jgi:hypothetical protein
VRAPQTRTGLSCLRGSPPSKRKADTFGKGDGAHLNAPATASRSPSLILIPSFLPWFSVAAAIITGAVWIARRILLHAAGDELAVQRRVRGRATRAATLAGLPWRAHVPARDVLRDRGWRDDGRRHRQPVAGLCRRKTRRVPGHHPPTAE